MAASVVRRHAGSSVASSDGLCACLGAPGDIDGAALVWARTTAKRDGRAEIPPLTAARDVMLDSLRHERSTLAVATNEGVVIGFATAGPTTSSLVAEVRFVGVHDYWGYGVGRMVIARMADELVSADSSQPNSSSMPTNDAARRLYERMGWTRDEQPEVRYRL